MSGWKQRMDVLLERMSKHVDAEAWDEALDLINERIDAEGVRGKVWMWMYYKCRKCGHHEPYELEVGVEGPPAWKSDGTYIACAFQAGSCKVCGGEMFHADWSKDQTYLEPQKPVVENVFRVPRKFPVFPTRGIDDDGNVIMGKASSAFLSYNLGAYTNYASVQDSE